MSSQESLNLIGFRKDEVQQTQKRTFSVVFDRNFEIFPDRSPDQEEVPQIPDDNDLARNIQT